MNSQENFTTNLSSIPQGILSLQEIQGRLLSPEEQLTRTRELNRECAAIRRAFMPAEKLAMERKRGREYMALKRAFMTPEEREIENKRNRERVRLRRMYLPEEKKEAIRKMQRERLQRKRAEMTEEEKMIKRAKWRVQMQEKRAAFSEEEKNRLRTYNREKARQYRIKKQQLLQQGFSGQQQGFHGQQQGFTEEQQGFTGAWPPFDAYQPGGPGEPSQPPQQDQIETVPELPAFPTPLNLSQGESSAHSEHTEEESGPEPVDVKMEEVHDQADEPSSQEGTASQPAQLTTEESCDPAAAAASSMAESGGDSLPSSIQKPFQVVYKAVNKLRKFSHERYQTEEFERFDTATLNELLGEFYLNVEQLPWMGLTMTEFVIVMREGLICFMRDFLQIDIDNDPAFEGANGKFCTRLQTLMEKSSQPKDDAETGSGDVPRTSQPAPPELRVDKEATQRVVHFFRNYLVSQSKSENFETYPKEALIESLQDFYIHAKMLPQRSLPDPYRILRLRLAHYMKVTMNIDIVHDPAFEQANGICKLPGKIKSSLVASAPQKDEISFEDLVSLLQSEKLSPGHPQGLLNLCMFNVIFYLCRSVQHGLSDLMRLMHKETFLFEKDDKSKEYVTWQRTYVEKMPEVVGHPLCPVTNFKVYLSKLSPHTDTLWQHPLKKPSGSNVWYHANIPIGSRKIQLFVDKLCREVGLQTSYTMAALQKTPLDTMADAMRRARVSAVPLSGPSTTPGKQTKRRRGAPKTMADAAPILTPEALDNCLNFVDWSSILPEWTNLKNRSNYSGNIDFLKHLLEVYQRSSHGNVSLGEGQLGSNDPVVGLIAAKTVQSAERKQRARRLDAVLALRTPGSSSRRKPTVVQRRGAPRRPNDEQSDNSVGTGQEEYSGEMAGSTEKSESDQHLETNGTGPLKEDDALMAVRGESETNTAAGVLNSDGDTMENGTSGHSGQLDNGEDNADNNGDLLRSEGDPEVIGGEQEEVNGVDTEEGTNQNGDGEPLDMSMNVRQVDECAMGDGLEPVGEGNKEMPGCLVDVVEGHVNGN